MSAFITCSMCGHSFDPALHAACQACPLKRGCHLVCCPQCGFEMVNLQQSKWVQFVTRWLPKNKAMPQPGVPSLAEISPGQQARVIGFSSALPAAKRAHLQSYGLVPGRMVRVVQHTPVMIIQVEHTELALEKEMAREIEVQAAKHLSAPFS